MAKFLVQIGDNKVELEGATRDDAIKRVRLEPQYWKENKGENMTKEKQKETTSTTENTPKKRLATPLKISRLSSGNAGSLTSQLRILGNGLLTAQMLGD